MAGAELVHHQQQRGRIEGRRGFLPQPDHHIEQQRENEDIGPAVYHHLSQPWKVGLGQPAQPAFRGIGIDLRKQAPVKQQTGDRGGQRDFDIGA